MIVNLLTEHHLEFLSLKWAAEARPSLHMSKCHIVGNLMHCLYNENDTGSLMQMEEVTDSAGSTVLWFNRRCLVLLYIKLCFFPG